MYKCRYRIRLPKESQNVAGMKIDHQPTPVSPPISSRLILYLSKPKVLLVPLDDNVQAFPDAALNADIDHGGGQVLIDSIHP